MDPSHLEELLNESESSSLDFKRDQYPFENATDDQKSELLKDILAFANAWRRSDAYILIGVEDIKPGRSRPVGLSKHLDDADLQQFVNAKTNRKTYGQVGTRKQSRIKTALCVMSESAAIIKLFFRNGCVARKTPATTLRRG